MGYCTEYRLEISEEGNDTLDICDFREQIEQEACMEWYSPIKWYEHENFMRIYSERYPETVFGLYGDGEDSEDVWVKYFKNGKMQFGEVRIEYEDYDESKLK